jgi:hypothetical protein
MTYTSRSAKSTSRYHLRGPNIFMQIAGASRKLDDNYGLSKKASTINHSVVLLLFGNWFFIKLVLRYESGLCQAIRDHLCPVSLITAPESDYELVISVSYGDKEVISI